MIIRGTIVENWDRDKSGRSFIRYVLTTARVAAPKGLCQSW